MKTRTFIALGLLAALVIAPVAIAADNADDPKKAWTDPKVALTESDDFAIQGEFAGTIALDGAPQKVGLQIVALGGKKFHAVLYHGGLPGSGWDGKSTKHVTSADTPTEGAGLKPALFKFDAFHAVAVGKAVALFHADEAKGTKPFGQLDRIMRKSPSLAAAPPANATILFDGTEASLKNWNKGKLDGKLLTEGTQTAGEFGSFTLHLEFRLPFKPNRLPSNQDRGNSGLYIHNRYECQILDAFGLPYFHQPKDKWKAEFEADYGTKPNSDRTQWTGAFYKFKTPDVPACLPPLSWQTYDIEFTAAKFDATGKKTASARATVKLNGVTIHNDVELPKGTGAGGGRAEVPKGPLVLQGHGNPVRFRNIWIIPKD